MKLPLTEAIGKSFNHNVLGSCEVADVIDPTTGKVRVKVLSTLDEKVLLFSSQYFKDIDEYESVNAPSKKYHKQKAVSKQVDLNKYRNHPLVKEIDRREDRRRVTIIEPQDSVEDDDEE